MIATSESLDGKVFSMLFYWLFVWCYWLQNRFIIDQQSSNKPKNIKPKTALFDTYHGIIYLKLGYTNFSGTFCVY